MKQNLFFILLLIFFPAAVLISLNYPNVILEQGTAHRIFYFHVSVAWVSLYAPIFSSIFSLLYLFKKNLNFDLYAFSLNQIGFLFSIAVLYSGPIWAYSAWGTYWDFTDARLQSFLILVISLLAYFLFRNFISEPFKRAKLSSFLSILCSLNAVLTWGAIRWIENPGNHPGSVLGKTGMDSDMRISFWLNVFAYHILFLNLLFILIHKNKLEYKLEEIRANQL
jgi:heme exporter protein C